MGRLEGKNAIVTGAANGQGRAVTLAFLTEGARVLAFDLDKRGLSALIGEIDNNRACLTRSGDVTVEEDVRSAVQAAVREFGSIDILYNNAGIYLRGKGDGLTHEIDLEVWNRVFAINATGMFLFCKHVLPTMMAQRAGSIINVSSIGGVVASDVHAYSASKGATISLTRCLAHNYAAYNIRANALAPGVVDTQMATPVTLDPEAGERYRRATPLGRWATSEEIAAVAVFLASNESSYITGAVLPVDGGLSAR